MASLQEPEVQLAQRLASNHKPIRTRAMKKLRKYVQVRSLNVGGGFTLDELLKLWKGLFYCLWMQDKPLLQMDLSKLVAAMIHNFQNFDAQLLYLQASLQTFKREWNGIDRLRMDKFFQLVRYMFHQSFEVLRRRMWDSGGVDGFLKVVNDELLQRDCEAPSGLQIHVLDVYLTELAAVGAQELTADQNLQFIQPFCRIATETDNMLLFGSICGNIFSTISSQAPFAIEDLIKELKTAKTSGLDQDSDSGQASEDELESEDQVINQQKQTGKNIMKQMNGIKAHELDDDELLNLEDSDVPADEEDIGPVLQFDYGAIADKLLELASRQEVPSRNRKKLYKVIKTFRNLSGGIFPPEHRPEPQQPSSDEEDDDEELDSRNILKRAREMLGLGDGVPAAKKRKRRRKKKKKEHAPAEALDLEKEKEEGGGEVEQLEKLKKKTKLIDSEQNGRGNEEGAGESSRDLSQIQAVSVDMEPVVSSMEAEPGAIVCSTAKGGKRKRRRRKKDNEVLLNSAETVSGKVPCTTMKQSDTTSLAKQAPQTHTDTSLPGEELLSAASLKTNMAGRRNKNALPVEAEGYESGEATPTIVTPGRKTELGAPQTPLVTSTQPHVDKGRGDATSSMQVMKRKKPIVAEMGGDDDSGVRPRKVTKKKKKIPVVFEFEADEVAVVNGAGKLADPMEDSAVLLPVSSRRKKGKKQPKSGFVTFQKSGQAPTPLFCRTKTGQHIPKTSKKMKTKTKSESKKVTFHLMKNQTAEFRKSDRSVLLSPHGPSRVVFDPEQKPKSGVLKSPLPPNTTMSAGRKTTAARKRPSAADFF